MEQIFEQIKTERKHQDSEWGVQRHDPFVWLAILGEEVGEVNKAVLENFWEDDDMEKYREELIQVAAVAVAAIESFDDLNDNVPEDEDYETDWKDLSEDELNFIVDK